MRKLGMICDAGHKSTYPKDSKTLARQRS
jgi:hypothetical protein